MANSEQEWTLSPGDLIRRTDLHEQFGGRRQGGIGPSAQTANVFVFSDPDSGEQHGYVDSWKEDGCFHYTGEGQRGDQQMTHGNRAILEAASDNRAIRVFKGTGGVIEYIDEFKLDDQYPFYTTDAPETGGGPVRSVIVFRLIPVNIDPHSPEGSLPPPSQPEVQAVPVESQNVERTYVEPSREEYEAERRESTLVQRYKAYLETAGNTVERLRMRPAGEVKPLFSDLYVVELGLLIEAKGSVDRQSIRMAIGQLIDYRRFVTPAPRCALLVPSRPRDDLVALVSAAGMELIWEKDSVFHYELRP
jgi:hypothetical protein